MKLSEFKSLAAWEPTCPLFLEADVNFEQLKAVLQGEAIDCYACQHNDFSVWFWNYRHPRAKKRPECKAGGDKDWLYRATIGSGEGVVIEVKQ